MKIVCRADWLIKEQYPDVRKAGASRWAWEFLRRNPDYDADWQVYVKAKRSVALKNPALSQYVECLIVDTVDSWGRLRAACPAGEEFSSQLNSWNRQFHECGDVEMSVYDPPRIAGETNAAYLNRVGQSTYRPLIRFLGEKWGLENLVQPANADYKVPRVVFTGRLHALGVSFPNLDFRLYKNVASRGDWLAHCEGQIERLGANFPDDEAAYRSVIAFDLRYPIKSQIAAAGRHLEWLQGDRKISGAVQPQRAHKKQPREWLNYLRAMDAIANDVSVDKIVSALLPNEVGRNDFANGYSPRKKVVAWLAAGEELMMEGYRAIALIPEMKHTSKEK